MLDTSPAQLLSWAVSSAHSVQYHVAPTKALGARFFTTGKGVSLHGFGSLVFSHFPRRDTVEDRDRITPT
jgi:hypothetical protein